MSVARSTVASMNRCRRCDVELAHCHGTLVRHDDGGWECTAPGCTGDVVAHDLVLVCAEQWIGCCATHGEFRRAS